MEMQSIRKNSLCINSYAVDSDKLRVKMDTAIDPLMQLVTPRVAPLTLLQVNLPILLWTYTTLFILADFLVRLMKRISQQDFMTPSMQVSKWWYTLDLAPKLHQSWPLTLMPSSTMHCRCWALGTLISLLCSPLNSQKWWHRYFKPMENKNSYR